MTTPARSATSAEDAPDAVWVTEPPRRRRQPIDGLRLVLALTGVVIVLLGAAVAHSTAAGFQQDIRQVTIEVPPLLRTLTALVPTLALLLLPVAVVVDVVVRKQPWRVLDVLLATVLGGLGAVAVNVWIDHLAPRALADAVTVFTSGGRQPATAPFLAGVTALLTAADLRGRRTAQVTAWSVVGAGIGTSLLSGVGTAVGAIVTLLVGRAGGVAVLYALGRPASRPGAARVIESLARGGLAVSSLRLVSDPEDSRSFLATLPDGGVAAVRVLDRDQQGAGLLALAYRFVRLRTPVQRRALLSVRRAMEHEALVSLAVEAAGVATPRLLAVCDAGPDAGIVAHRYVAATPFSRLEPDAVTDEVLAGVWRELARMHGRRLCHRSLTPAHVLVDASGGIWFTDMRSGDIAASDLALRMDVAQLLATLSASVGPDRAVLSAIEILGGPRVAAAAPLLQPVALSRGTWARVRSERAALSTLRARVLAEAERNDVDVEPVRLQRVNLRTLLTWAVVIVAGYVILGQLGTLSFRTVIADSSGTWAAAAVAASAATYVGATVALIAFSPVRLPFGRALLAQVASSFVALAAPAAVGMVALNVRFLRRREVDGPLAVATVGVTQVASFISHLVLLIVFGLFTGRASGGSLLPSRTAVMAILAVSVVALAVLAIPPARELARRRLAPTLSRVIPSLVDVVTHPRRLTAGLGGAFLVTISYVLALFCAVRAVGGTLSLAAVGVVFLAGSAIGSLVPTPGGLGAIEAAIAGGLIAAGMPGDLAASATLIYRLATFWLPVPFGWVGFTTMQRRRWI